MTHKEQQDRLIDMRWNLDHFEEDVHEKASIQFTLEVLKLVPLIACGLFMAMLVLR